MDSHRIVMMYVVCLNKQAFPMMALVFCVMILSLEAMCAILLREGLIPPVTSLSWWPTWRFDSAINFGNHAIITREPLQGHITLTTSLAVARDTRRSLLTMALNNLMAVIIRGQSGRRHLNHGSMLNIVSGIKWHYHMGNRAIDPMLYHLSMELLVTMP